MNPRQPDDGDPRDPTSTDVEPRPAVDSGESSAAPSEGEAPSEPAVDATTIEALIQTSVHDALARWDAAFGVTPEDEAEVEDELAGFDARKHLAAASTRAVNHYLAERGLGTPDGAPLSVTPAFIAEHGVALMSALFAALEQAITGAVRDHVEGRKPTQLEPEGRLQLDLSDFFDPEEP